MRQKYNSVIKFFIIPVLLLIFGGYNLFNYLKAGEFGLLNLDVHGDFTDLVSPGSGELLKGDKVLGSFHSDFPNLGVILVRFYNQDRDSNDTLAFRLKESGQQDWYYQANYKTDQFLPHQTFPFGFPVIANSANRDFDFELESLSGATGSGILVDYEKPVFIAKSSFTRGALLKDKQLLSYFVINKFINVFGDADTRTNTLFSFLPFIIYLLYLLTEGVSFQILTSMAVAFACWDIFYLQSSYDLLYLSILFFWALISKRFRFESRIAASFALAFLIITPLLLIAKQDSLAEKSAVWSYLFLCITIIQQIYELRVKQKKLFSIKSFYKNITKVKIALDSFLRKVPPIVYILLDIFASAALINSTINNVRRVFEQYRTYFPTNFFGLFIKGTLFAFVASFIILYLVFYFSKKSKGIWPKVAIFSLSAYLIFGFFLGKTTNFVGDIKIFSLSIPETSEAWVDIVVYGKNFKDKPFVGKLYIDGVEQRVISWTDKAITFRTNPETTKTGMVTVVTTQNKKSNSIDFIYDFK